VPHHAGLRLYERVAFQWSCHTIAAACRNAGEVFAVSALAFGSIRIWTFPSS
jgi:hypothetical protein